MQEDNERFWRKMLGEDNEEPGQSTENSFYQNFQWARIPNWYRENVLEDFSQPRLRGYTVDDHFLKSPNISDSELALSVAFLRVLGRSLPIKYRLSNFNIASFFIYDVFTDPEYPNVTFGGIVLTRSRSFTQETFREGLLLLLKSANDMLQSLNLLPLPPYPGQTT